MKTQLSSDNEISENPKFKSREDFLSFLKSIENDPDDDAPELKKFLARLYNHHGMPSLDELDLFCVCQRSCGLSEDDTSKYLLGLYDTGFLLYTNNLPTKVLEDEIIALTGKKPGSYYLNVDFYEPDRFTGRMPNVAHGDDIYKESE